MYVIAFFGIFLAALQTYAEPNTDHLDFIAETSDVLAGKPILPPIQVAVKDASGKIDKASSAEVELQVLNRKAHLRAKAIHGVATFSNLVVEIAGKNLIVRASSLGLKSKNSKPFNVRPGDGNKLAFIKGPTKIHAGRNFSPPLTVEVQDLYGNHIKDSQALILLDVGHNPSGASTLVGNYRVNAVLGTATFSEVAVSFGGQDITLVASSEGLKSATSNKFPVIGPNAVISATVPPMDANKPGYADFITYIAPHINAIAPIYKWGDIDKGEVNGNGVTVPCEEATTCDWTAIDSELMAFVDAGLNINLLMEPMGEGKGGVENTITPAYVFSPGYANLLGSAPQDQTVCAGWTGDPEAPVIGSSAVSGVWNYNQCTVYPYTNCSTPPPYKDISGFPVVYEKPFMTAYQAFIEAVSKHFSPSGSTVSGQTIGSHMNYIRFGMASAAENIPKCNPVWPGPQGQAAQPYPNYKFNSDAYLAGKNSPPGYVNAMLAAEQAANLNSGNKTRAMVTSAAWGMEDEESALAAQHGVGFGMEFLNIADVYNYNTGQPDLCWDDWCNNFNTYRDKGLMLYLQTTVPNTQPAYDLLAVASNNGNAAVATCSSSNQSVCDFLSNYPFIITGNSNPLFNGLFRSTMTQTGPTISFTLPSSGFSSTGAGGTAWTADDLAITLPFAVQRHAKALEIFSCDLFEAFDPNPMPEGVICTIGSPAGVTNGPYARQYRSVITTISGKP